MAGIDVKLKVKRRWWVVPLLYVGCVVVRLAGRDQFPDWFVAWIFPRGFKIEVDE